nr:hypothetical protein GCM10020093_018620 [Planobispora longispora]
MLHLTGSPADLGIVVLSTRLPVIALTLLGGALGDRFSRRGVMLLADLMRFLAHGATAVLLLTGTAQIWMLVVLQLLAGAGSAFFNPAAVGLVPSLAGRKHLQAANSLLAVSRSATSILALGTAGALVAVAGPGWAVLIDALSFLISAAFLYRLPGPPPRSRTGHAPDCWRHRRRGRPGDGAILAEVVDRPRLPHEHDRGLPILVLGPYIADDHLGGAPAWSAIGIGYAAGGIAGGVIAARWRPARPMVAALSVFLLMIPLRLCWRYRPRPGSWCSPRSPPVCNWWSTTCCRPPPCSTTCPRSISRGRAPWSCSGPWSRRRSAWAWPGLRRPRSAPAPS